MRQIKVSSFKFQVSSLGARFQRRTILIVLACTVLLASLVYSSPGPRVPSLREVQADYHPSDVPLLDRSGEVLQELRVDTLGRRLPWTPLAEISPALQAAVITSEDQRFHRHSGVDEIALTGAGVRWLMGKPLRGASTITMQMVTFLFPEIRSVTRKKTLFQKWQQMRLAWALERRWSKTEILEAYLNFVTFRGEVQGIAAAARVLFGKMPHGITASEAAVLAVLIRSPNASRETVERRVQALQQAQTIDFSPAAAKAAMTLALRSRGHTALRISLAPHAAQRLRQSTATPVPLRSTLDGALQRFAAETLQRHLLEIREQHVTDGAVLVADNATGEVLAYVGGSGDLSSARYVDGIQARRQAGSSLKPFLYALAFERRLLTPASLLEDTPLDLPVTTGLYRPRNYDESFRGLVTARTALASSLNVPAVRVLELVGANSFLQQLRGAGFVGLTETGDYYGPALALGSADVSLWEQVNAYRTLASGGIWSPLRLAADPGSSSFQFPVSSFQPPGSSLQFTIRNPQSAIRNPQSEGRLYAEEAVFLVSSILADREARSTTFGLENAVATPFWSAVKTGTSKDMRDNWCIGYSRRYTVGVWVGNFSGEPMRDVSGVTGAAPIWSEIMTWLHRDVPSRAPQPPAGVLARHVMFPRESEPARMEWFLTGTEPYASTLALAAGQPRILAPAAGTVIALDPDIPPPLQRVVFEAQAHDGQLRWTLDGADMGTATDVLLWTPVPGSHTLAVTDEEQRVLDSVTFTVRGSLLPVHDG